MAVDGTGHSQCCHWTFTNHPRFMKQKIQKTPDKDTTQYFGQTEPPCSAVSLQQLSYLLLLCAVTDCNWLKL